MALGLNRDQSEAVSASAETASAVRRSERPIFRAAQDDGALEAEDSFDKDISQIAKPHFEGKMALLKAAIDNFLRKEPIAVIKIVLSEIEGILNDAHRAANGGQGAKLKKLREFAIESAQKKSGRLDTLFFPEAFAKYLDAYTFADFDPAAQTGTAGSRHAVGHGAARQESYTMTRALQALLTLDQIAFYT